MMKYYIYPLLMMFFSISVNSAISAAIATTNLEIATTSSEKINNSRRITVSPKTDKKMDVKKWLPLGLGILGLALIFVPYLSLIGLIAGIAAVVTGFLFRKKYPKTARWGIWLGGICIVAFLAVLGLILFF